MEKIEYEKVDYRLHAVCKNCGYTYIQHGLKPIYVERAKLMNDHYIMRTLNKICDNFVFGGMLEYR